MTSRPSTPYAANWKHPRREFGRRVPAPSRRCQTAAAIAAIYRFPSPSSEERPRLFYTRPLPASDPASIFGAPNFFSFCRGKVARAPVRARSIDCCDSRASTFLPVRRPVPCADKIIAGRWERTRPRDGASTPGPDLGQSRPLLALRTKKPRDRWAPTAPLIARRDLSGHIKTHLSRIPRGPHNYFFLRGSRVRARTSPPPPLLTPSLTENDAYRDRKLRCFVIAE